MQLFGRTVRFHFQANVRKLASLCSWRWFNRFHRRDLEKIFDWQSWKNDHSKLSITAWNVRKLHEHVGTCRSMLLYVLWSRWRMAGKQDWTVNKIHALSRERQEYTSSCSYWSDYCGWAFTRNLPLLMAIYGHKALIRAKFPWLHYQLCNRLYNVDKQNYAWYIYTNTKDTCVNARFLDNSLLPS